MYYMNTGKPSVIISRNILTEGAGQSTVITCTATQRSLPSSLRAGSLVEYTWSSDLDPGRYTGNGNRLIVGTVSRLDNGATVTCMAREQGSSLTGSKSATLVVYCESDV